MKKQRPSRKELTIYEMRRNHPVEMAKLDQFAVQDNVEIDPLFEDLYTQYLKGNRSISHSRLSIERITPGFLIDDGGAFPQYKRDPIDEKAVQHIAIGILKGARHTLHVYKNRTSSEHEFLCPDDVNAYEAYRILDIRKVPVAILDDNPNLLEESAIVISISKSEEPLYSFREIQPTKVECFLLGEKSNSSAYKLNLLETKVKEAVKKLRMFHFEDENNIHYHHTLASVLHRLVQTVQAIRVLLKNRLEDQAIVQLRAMYELVLTFYIDWLAPEIIGSKLQSLAVFSKHEWMQVRQEVYAEKRTKGWSDEEIKALKQSDNRLYDCISKVSEKAKLNPLASKHKDLYKHLSRFAHQDFTVTARYAHTLNDFAEAPTDQYNSAWLITCVNFLVAQVVTKIVDDIGDKTVLLEMIRQS